MQRQQDPAQISGTSGPIQEVLSRLEQPIAKDKGWLARCPVPGHGKGRGDKKPSLSISEGADGRVLLKCWGECAFEEILSALHLEKKDLFPKRIKPKKPRPAKKPARNPKVTVAELAADKLLPEDFLRGLDVRDIPSGVSISYKLEDGAPAPRQRLRLALKAKDGSRWSRGDASPVPYGLWKLGETLEPGYLIIVEGESDCWTCWHHGFPVLGIPGASMAKTLDKKHVEGISRIFVVEEPDKAGKGFIKALGDRITELGWQGTIAVIRLEGAKDPNDLHKLDPANFKIAFQDALDKAEPLEQEAPESIETDPYVFWCSPNGRYGIEKRQMGTFSYTDDGDRVFTPLSNFAARIIEEVTYDDGAGERSFFIIEGRTHTARVLPAMRVPLARFQMMSWPLENWGVVASIEPGQSKKDQARYIIQNFCNLEVRKRRVFEHTGWREVGGKWLYLHADGGIGPAGPEPTVEVALEGSLARYRLPIPANGDETVSAVRASLGMLRLAPLKIVVPVWAAIWRAALGATDLSLHISGRTGVFKSELTALAQSHFGPEMDARHLPANWSATGNSLEVAAFGAKDALFAVDDFAPTGTSYDVQRAHRDADRLFRAQGNQAGRQRLNADSTLKHGKHPRGLIISTGEDIPRGHSLRARMLIVEVSAGDIDRKILTSCQSYSASGLYAGALAGFVHWLAPRYSEIKARLRQERDTLARAASSDSPHGRTPRIIADLALGLRYFLDFALDAEAVSVAEGRSIWQQGRRALIEAAAVQSGYQDAGEPARKFIELLSASISSWESHVASSEGGAPDNAGAWGWSRKADHIGGTTGDWFPKGNPVGWLDGDDLYLVPMAAYAAAQSMGNRTSDALAIGERTLWKRLKERGMLATVDEKRQTLKVRRTLAGQQRLVLHLHAEALSSLSEPDKPDNSSGESPGQPSSSDPWTWEPDIRVGSESRPDIDPTEKSPESSTTSEPDVGNVGKIESTDDAYRKPNGKGPAPEMLMSGTSENPTPEPDNRREEPDMSPPKE